MAVREGDRVERAGQSPARGADDQVRTVEADELAELRIRDVANRTVVEIQHAGAAGRLATRLHGECRAVIAPGEFRRPGPTITAVRLDRRQEPDGIRGIAERTSPDAKVRAGPAIDPELQQRVSGRAEGRPPYDVRGRPDRGGTAGRRVEQEEARCDPVIGPDEDPAAERSGSERFRIQRDRARADPTGDADDQPLAAPPPGLELRIDAEPGARPGPQRPPHQLARA